MGPVFVRRFSDQIQMNEVTYLFTLRRTFVPGYCIFLYSDPSNWGYAVIDRSGFFTLLQDQKLLQNQRQKLLPDSEAPVQAEAPV